MSDVMNGEVRAAGKGESGKGAVMNRKFSASRRRSAWLFGRGALAPLLVAYLFVGACGGGKSGFVLAFKAGKVVVTAAWCAPGAPDRS